MTGRANGNIAVVYSDDYLVRLGGLEKLHPFDIHKYEKIVDALVANGAFNSTDVFEPEPASRADLELVHSGTYLDTFSSARKVATYLEAPILGTLPGSVIRRSVVAAFEAATGGTILAADLALQHGIAINVGGGYHHAKPDLGEGFNLVNDIAIAIRRLQAQRRIERALVVDLDVHQGNGTAVCFQGDDDVFTFSMHQREIYPIPKETSDLDVELTSGVTDDVYLDTLGRHWPEVIDRADPDIVIYQAGCDPLEGDPLASLAVSRSGIARRDSMIVDELARRGIPVAVTLGGGYSDEAWEVQYESLAGILERHR